MNISDKKLKILFIVFINVLIFIPLINYSTAYLTKSYMIKENDLDIVDTVSFKYVSGELSGAKTSRRIEMTATNNEEFRIWNTSIDGIKDRQLFFDKVNNPESIAIIYSTKKIADKYKKGKSNFTTIKQVEIEKVKFIDLDKVNNEENNIVVRNVVILPILALIMTLFFGYNLLWRTEYSS